jgi:hypothetical protein
MEQAHTETQVENFIKEYVSLILLLTIFTAAVRNDSIKQPAVHPIMQQPQRSK